MIKPHLYSFSGLMDRLTSRQWIVMKIGSDQFAFATLV